MLAIATVTTELPVGTTVFGGVRFSPSHEVNESRWLTMKYKGWNHG
ncbi:hypothetical protein HWB90_gp043 [Mycobacterium phage Fowlmouth]|uniref:Uncharacterized protein n=1 Tax=Mycobacterium phage Fowlmouth TaxID=2419978 RepID=A0A3G2KG82_9CAUD|nr:hypothetical protein HWB90_gp043 [Mycobacterium phage Fowlmouth]AYN57993.1 hypothetical protein SEA_FOWLMOUTH_43 [Mycobacterium phage Fowlmouth]